MRNYCKVSNKNTRRRVKLTLKTPERHQRRRSVVFIFNLDLTLTLLLTCICLLEGWINVIVLALLLLKRFIGQSKFILNKKCFYSLYQLLM